MLNQIGSTPVLSLLATCTYFSYNILGCYHHLSLSHPRYLSLSSPPSLSLSLWSFTQSRQY